MCLGRFLPSAGDLRCEHGHAFPIRDGLPSLLPPEEQGLIGDATTYAAAWKRTKWAPPPDGLRQLPYGTRGRARSFWEPKARSLEALLRILGPSNGRIVIDAGAGTGWLSHRLAGEGFRCFAIDGTPDADVGLGAARAFDDPSPQFERALGSLSRWPFRSASADIAVCNASLHYLADPMAALVEARRVLRPGGRLFVMNSPVHRDARSAMRAEAAFRARLDALGLRGRLFEDHRHFVASVLERDLRQVFPQVHRHEPRFGVRFRLVRVIKGIGLRMNLAAFPIYEAYQAGGSEA